MDKFEIVPLEFGPDGETPEVWCVLIREPGKKTLEEGPFGSVEEAQAWVDTQKKDQ